MENYPVIMRHDLGTNFPAGETGLNQSFFDVAVATVAKLTMLSPNTVLAWSSPVLIALACSWLYLWIAGSAGRRCGALFLLLFLAYPGTLTVLGALGQGDHHAAEIFLAVAVAWSLDRLLRPGCPWKWAPLAALPLLCFHLMWAGSPMHLALVGGIFFVAAWRPGAGDDDPGLRWKGTLYGASLLLALLLISAVAPWAIIWATAQRIYLLSCGLLAVGYPVLVLYAQRPWKHRALAAGAMTLLPALAVLAYPPTRGMVFSLFEQRSELIAEQAAISFAQLTLWFGLLWLVAIPSVARFFWRRSFWTHFVPFLYAVGLILLWLKTRDFNYYAGPILAAGGAYVLEGLAFGWAFFTLLGCLLTFPLLSGKEVQHPWMDTAQLRESIMVTDGLEEASAWLETTKGDIRPTDPEAFGLVTPWDMGNILAQTSKVPVGWSQTTSPELAQLLFSDQPDAVYARLTAGEKPLRYIFLPARNLGEKFLGEMMVAGHTIPEMYVQSRIVEWNGMQLGMMGPSERNKASFMVRLYWDMAANLGHYRMVFESANRSVHSSKLITPEGKIEFNSFPLDEKSEKIFQPLWLHPETPMRTSRGDLVDGKVAPEIRLFEAVPGALLQGDASPGSTVRASIDLYAPNSKKAYSVHYDTQANAEGRFELRLPYPTDQPMSPASGTVQVPGDYHVVIDGKTSALTVTEDEIQKGAILAVAR